MTPLAGVVDQKSFEQRIATIDLSTDHFTQVTPADIYVYEYDWTPDGKSWPPPRLTATAMRIGGSLGFISSTQAPARCARSINQSCNSPTRESPPTARTSHSLKDS